MAEAPELKPLIEQALVEVFEGKGAHVSPLACLEDLHADLAGRKVDGHPHSIWEIALHLSYWMTYELQRIQGKPMPYPSYAEESWPPPPARRTEQCWRDTVTHFGALLNEWEELSRSDTDVLARSVVSTHTIHSQQASSVLAVLMQIIAHNSYHIGQVVLLRRLLGAWPP